MTEQRGPWRILSRRQHYDNRWIQVTHHEVITPAGQAGVYGTVHFKNLAVGVVPVDHEQHTYLVGQYRFPIEEYSWEIPEGGGTFGAPKDSAARELQEETGLVARQWQKLTECNLSNSLTDERAIIFLAWDLTQGPTSPDPTEEIEIRRLPLAEAFEMVKAGNIRDVMSVVALQAVQLLQLDGRLPDFRRSGS